MEEAGRLAGIARHDRPRGPMQTVSRVLVTRELGVAGDYRGAVRPGKKAWRQVSLLEADGWADAMAALGPTLVGEIPWYERRANLLVEGLKLPRQTGAIIAIGPDLRMEVTGECDPCSRMEEIAPGLKAALLPFWRGGFLTRVISDGTIAVGDEVRIEL